ncbi:GNAT family N-acetyltransferase [Bradyrhizobium sp. AUGA SZCCT0222]|uniref:GNAT family N-acetyltransferase n=1 Tax=Bradyrhizobium sp. AUGA SZCCT0222 TaxID=2807668 RepID=UPI001BACA27B|nr:GNAT family protein [Bradyrhizobium sp. AUGA SZCCT0222]MBR1267954.1 GNAT family N-acetyltransferase [Bradyrhizobium sp. AUGA SZCCT0222]
MRSAQAHRGWNPRLRRRIGPAAIAVLQICFEDLAAHRVELFVFVENERAYRTYLKTGFVEEGVVRDLHRDPDGAFRSMRLMSMLRGEWVARP